IKVESSPFPTGVVNLLELAENRIDRNLNVSPTKNAGANTSASAILQAEQSVLLGSEFLIENHNRAMRQMGRVLLAMIRKYYDAGRIYRMLSDKSKSMGGQPSQPMPPGQEMPPGMPQPPGIMVGGQPLEDYSEEEIKEFLSVENLEKLDVMAGEANWTPTQRMATLTVLTDLMGKGAPVPPDMLVQFLDLPDDLKKQMAQGIQQQQQAQSQTESKTNETELQKSLIGKSLFPPKVLEEQGIGPDQLQRIGMTANAPQAPQLPQQIPQTNMPPGSNAPIQM
ncbi:MAG: hypothetical protein KBC84_09225, partial [Proteobacteria bacterium]|nr:hypothetical protein [Pseudomonadota bacterium]